MTMSTPPPHPPPPPGGGGGAQPPNPPPPPPPPPPGGGGGRAPDPPPTAWGEGESQPATPLPDPPPTAWGEGFLCTAHCVGGGIVMHRPLRGGRECLTYRNGDGRRRPRLRRSSSSPHPSKP